MILGRDNLSKLKIDLCFFDNKIWGNEGAYKGCTALMNDVTKTTPSAYSHDKNFQNEELWESEHRLDTTRISRCVLDSHYKKSDLGKVASNN